MRLSELNEDWALGFQDETWWSRLALPSLHAFSEEGKPVRLVQQSVAKEDPDPKAISCYGLYLPEIEETWLRFVDGRPISGITTRFLGWLCQKLAARGKKVWVLIWDNAPWHVSKEVRAWIDSHNRAVKKSGRGVRIIGCLLPTKSPWLNPIEPKWVHGKRRVVEADGLLSAHQLAERVCKAFDCPHYEHLSIPQNAA
jgi:transposase